MLIKERTYLFLIDSCTDSCTDSCVESGIFPGMLSGILSGLVSGIFSKLFISAARSVISDCLSSIRTLRQIESVENLFSSWEPPIQGRDKIDNRMEQSIAYLQRIHSAVISNSNLEIQQDIMALCQKVVDELGLPAFAVNPLVAKAFASSLAATQNPKNAQTDA